jgi:hypothetical protein
LTCIRTLLKAYEIAYISSSDTKTWIKSLPCWIQTFPESVLGKQRANCSWTLLKTCIDPKPWGQLPPNLNSNYFKKFTTTLVYNLEHENHHSIAQIVILLKLSRNQRIIKLYDNISFKHCKWPHQLDQHLEHVKRTPAHIMLLM